LETKLGIARRVEKSTRASHNARQDFIGDERREQGKERERERERERGGGVGVCQPPYPID